MLALRSWRALSLRSATAVVGVLFSRFSLNMSCNLQAVPEGDWFCMKCTAAGHRVPPQSHVVTKTSTTPSPPPVVVDMRTSSSVSEGNGSARGEIFSFLFD